MLSKNDELFLTVAKSESISKAAEQLYISQPSLTKRMQQLEAQLGVALFDHKSRPLKLSPAGELYYEYLTRSAVQEHALLLDLREAAEGRRGKLSVGAPANLAQSLFPAILPSFCRTFPNVSLSVVEATGAEIQTLIAGRQLDMAFAHIHIADTNVSYIPLSTEKIYLAARRPANLMDTDPPPAGAAAGGGGPAAVSVLYVQQKSDDLRLLPPVFPALQHYSRHADPLRRSGHQPHAGGLSGKLRLFRPQLLHWPDTVGYSAKAYFLRHRRPRAQLGAAGAVPSGQRSGHLRPGDDTTGQRDALAPLAVNRPRQQKIPGAPKACRVSASYCICSQPIKARCAG